MKILFTFVLYLFLVPPCFAGEFDVDNADSLDFESFHEKKDSQKSMNTPPAKTKNVDNSSQTIDLKSSNPVVSKTKIKDHKNSSRFFIRELYSNENSGSQQSVTRATERLHQQMAQICPDGWQKLSEKSVPSKKGFHLYFELSCL